MDWRSGSAWHASVSHLGEQRHSCSRHSPFDSGLAHTGLYTPNSVCFCWLSSGADFKGGRLRQIEQASTRRKKNRNKTHEGTRMAHPIGGLDLNSCGGHRFRSGGGMNPDIDECNFVRRVGLDSRVRTSLIYKARACMNLTKSSWARRISKKL